MPNNTPADQEGGRFLKPTIAEFDITKFRNGDQLFEDCTNCHRGDNVFLIHDELEDVPRTAANQRYTPIPEATKPSYVPELDRIWSNPSRRRADGDENNLMRADGCGGCHKMPALSWPYCTSVLRPAITRGLMPPTGGLSETERDTLVCRDFCLLLRECVLLSPKGMGGQEVWNLFGSAPAGCSCDARWQAVWPIAEATPD